MNADDLELKRQYIYNKRKGLPVTKGMTQAHNEYYRQYRKSSIERYASSLASSRKWKSENKVKARTKQKEWNKDNKDKLARYQRNWYNKAKSKNEKSDD